MKIKTLLATALAAAPLLAAPLGASAGALSPFKAVYEVHRGSLALGEAKFSLSQWGDAKNCMAYRAEAQPRALIRVFVGEINDKSFFCVDDKGQIKVQQFQHYEEKDEEDSYDLKFDWDKGQVTYSHGGSFPLPAGAVDPFSLHLAARQWLESEKDPKNAKPRDFVLIDEDEVKTYRLAVTDHGRVKVPAGEYDYIQIERVDDPKRKLRFMVAPALSFLPIKVEHQKRDDPIIKTELISLPEPPAK